MRATALELAWRSPDADQPNPKTANKWRDVSKTFKGGFRKDSAGHSSFKSQAQCEAVLDLDQAGNLKINADGTNAVVPESPSAAVPYPVAGRRVPATLLDGPKRAWSWQGVDASRPAIPTLVVEWQPPIVNPDGTELILGGNGTLKLETLSVADRTISPPSPDNAPAGEVLRLPTFRVQGANPPAANIGEIRDAAIRDVMRANASAGQVRMLNAAVWRWLASELITGESGGKHFDTGVDRKCYTKKVPYKCYGVQKGMPRFGPPSGFGLGQHDPPLSLDDLWSFYAHLRGGVEFLIMKKGGAPTAT